MGMKHVDVLIIGAGAAGLFCGIEAAQRGRTVLIIDHAKAPAQKIRISGGGRCNFTNMEIEPDRFLSQNPRFAVSALSRYTQWDFIDRVAKANIAYHEKTLGQLFCDDSAQLIIDMLLTDFEQAGGSLWVNTSVSAIETGFTAETSRGTVQCETLVIACGGKSIPKMGASGFGYEVAKQFDLPIVDTRPALVPLTFADQELPPIKAMAGTSVHSNIECNGTQFDEGMLFTHRGLSGPSILQISSYWREGDSLRVNLASKADVFEPLRAARQTAGRVALHTALAAHLPKTVARFVVDQTGLTGNLADQSDKSLRLLADAVHTWKIKPVGSEGYRTAEVTLGGISTDALDSKTMMASNVDGLFFIGEVVDVTGWLGGYNFQWAWSSGWAAGQVC